MKSEKGFFAIEILVGFVVFAIVVGLIIGVIMWNYKTTYGNVQTLEITVKDKYIKRVQVKVMEINI